MKAGGGVIVTGDEALDAILATIEPRIQKKLTRQATRKAAKEIVLPEARNRVPVDTGDLEDSLTVRAVARSRYRVGHMVMTRDGFFKGDQFYGSMVEFGTKERKQKSTGKKVGRILPHEFSFLRPAGYDSEPKVRALVIADIRQAISEIPSKT